MRGLRLSRHFVKFKKFGDKMVKLIDFFGFITVISAILLFFMTPVKIYFVVALISGWAMGYWVLDILER